MSTESDLSLIRDGLDRELSHCEVENISHIYVATRDGTADEPLVIEANRCGLLYLAAQLVALAEQQEGAHLHFDEADVVDPCERNLIISLVASPW